MTPQRKTTRRVAAGLGLSLMLAVVVLLLVGTINLIHQPETRYHVAARLRGGEFLGRQGIVFQEEHNDCGAAALKMVFDHHGIDRPLSAWTSDLIDRPEGTSMLRLKEITERWGLRAEGWRIALADLKTIPLPAIALLNRDHYVVIEAIEETGYLIYADPSFGRVRMNCRLFMRKSRGELLLILKK